MKQTLTTVLGAVALVAVTALVTARLTTKAELDGPLGPTKPVPIWAYDTSGGGSGTGAHPLYVFNPFGLSAGSELVVRCANKDCAGIASAASGNSNILFELKIPIDLPPNTEMSLSFRPAPGAK